MLTNKLLKCIYPPLGFTQGSSYQVHLNDDYERYVYDDDGDTRYSPFNEVKLGSFEIVDVNTTAESCQANDGVANYITSDLTKQIEANIKDIIDNNFNGDVSNLKITETVKPVAIDTNGSDIVNITVTTELKITRVISAEKRYNVIKKLYDRGDIVVVSCWDTGSDLQKLQILSRVRDINHKYPYVVFGNVWKYAYAVDRKGNEITEVLDE